MGVLSKFEQLCFKRMHPSHQPTLAQDRLCVARMRYNTRTLSEPECCLSIVTGSMVIQLGPRQLKQTEVFYKNLCYCDMANFHERVEGQHTFRYCTSAYPVPRETPFASEDLVFRCTTIGKDGEAIEPPMPGGSVALADSAKPELPELAWAVVQEGREDFYESVVRPHVVEKGLSASFQAPPRFGKTHRLQRLAVDLQAAGHTVQMVALCHVAVRNLGDTAMAVHAFCRRHVLNGTFKGWVLLDEVSQAPLALASCLAHLHSAGTNIVRFGDELQLRPVERARRGKPVELFCLQSGLLKLWCVGTCLELAHDWRSTDRTLADRFIQARHTDRETAIADALARILAKLSPADGNGCQRHQRHRLINAASQKLAALKYRESFPDGLVGIWCLRRLSRRMPMRPRRAESSRAQH